MSSDLLEVRLLPGKGRGYLAKTDIAIGTVVHISDPYATTVSQEWIPETCNWCFDYSYPKKQKVKIMTEQEQSDLQTEWSSKRNRQPKLPCKEILFCSERCRDRFRLKNPNWKMVLASHHRLEEEYKKSSCDDFNLSEEDRAWVSQKKYGRWISIDDDVALAGWLEEGWNVLTEHLDLYREMDETDKTMCRLIAACLLRKELGSDVEGPTFEDLLVIQNNELAHFREHAVYPDKKLPDVSKIESEAKKDIFSCWIPTQVMETMALYCFFARAFTTPSSVPQPISNLNHLMFRSIYFRERANSFGLWEMGQDPYDHRVSDDLELLGWGIYPSAVYFNHSCDANVVKVRDGRQMKFITKCMIYEGEEACISYGNVDEELFERRTRLLDHYHFTCQCVRCVEEEKQYITVR